MTVPKGQRSIFEFIVDAFSSKPIVEQWRLSVDGASRGNPGPAGAGIYLQKENEPVLQIGYFLGNKTNNEAEYLALLIGVILFKKEAPKTAQLSVISDSQLLIFQLEGKYKVKHPEMKKLNSAVVKELQGVPVTFTHVERQYNSKADELANQGVDTKRTLPLKVLDILGTHELFL